MTAKTTSCAPLVEGAATACCQCGAALCLRKQVLNLAVGNDEKMLCLVCLSQESQQTPQELLAGMKLYIQGRDCFRKEWVRYLDVNFCPARESCFPGICFDK